MASGTIKNESMLESEQTLTYTKSSQTLSARFQKIGQFVCVKIWSTGNISYTGSGWTSCFSGLREEFQPKETIIASIAQAPSKIEGFAIRGVNETSSSYGDAGDVRINTGSSTVSLWAEGYFIYYVG